MRIVFHQDNRTYFEPWLSDVGIRGNLRYLQVTGLNCKPASEGLDTLVHASIVENFNFSQYLFAIFTDQS
jgi:hypothetical protein